MKKLIVWFSLLCSTSLWALQVDVEVRLDMNASNEAEFDYQDPEYVNSQPDWRVVEEGTNDWGEPQRYAVYTKQGVELVDGRWSMSMDIVDVRLHLNEQGELRFDYSLEFYDGSNSLSTKLIPGQQHEFEFHNSDGQHTSNDGSIKIKVY